jgi:ATP-dependent DNA helicase RecG
VDNDIFIAEIPLTDHVPEKSNVGGLNGTLNDTLNGTLNGTLIKNIKESLNASQSKVFDFIMRNPGCMGKEITGALDMPRDTFNKIIRSLFEKKIIERRGSKKTGGYWVKGA